MNAGRLSRCVTATAAAMAKSNSSPALTPMEPMVRGPPLALRAHPRRFPCLRQHPLDEVQALLRVRQLLAQLGHIAFQRFELSLQSFGRSRPGLELAATGTGPQASGPEPERDGEHHVNRGMRLLALPGREPGRDHVDAAQHDGHRVPRCGLEGHDSPYAVSTSRVSQDALAGTTTPAPP